MADFERAAVELCMARLESVTPAPSLIKAIRVFVTVTDVFGLVYIRRDIASRMSRKREN